MLPPMPTALQATDACVTFSKERHETSINAIKVSSGHHFVLAAKLPDTVR